MSEFAERLHRACQTGSWSKVEQLLSSLDNKGVKTDAINFQDSNGWTALHHASANDQVEVVKYLLQNTCDLTLKNVDGNSPIHIAALNGHSEIVKLLLDNGMIDINKPNNEGVTALHFASEFGHSEVVKRLLEVNECQNDIVDSFDYTALQIASENGHEVVVKLLLAPLPRNSKNRNRAMLLAAENGHAAVIKEFLEHDSNLANCNSDAKTAFHLAAEFGRIEVLKILLAAEGCDANFDVVDMDRASALQLASQNGHAEAVKLLLEKKNKKPDINWTNRWGNSTSLHLAAINGHVEVVKVLVEGGADMDIVDTDGRTALYLSALKDEQRGMTEFLVSKGAKFTAEHLSTGKTLTFYN